MKTKERLDVLLVEKGFFNSREKAKRAIMAGVVFINQEKIDKPGTKVDKSGDILIKENPIPYVSRGGLKLEKSIENFNIDLSNKVCLDIGASTGGFTDCMLQNGAKKVYSIDVGYGQLDWKLRQDPRVVSMERTNVRYVTKEDIGSLADIASIDVSFISLRLVLPVVKELLNINGEIIALIKPQFEAGKEQVGKKGVVRDISVHKNVVKEIINFVSSINLEVIDFTYSPVKGPEGNIEYLLYMKNTNSSKIFKDIDYIENLIDESHKSL